VNIQESGVKKVSRDGGEIKGYKEYDALMEKTKKKKKKCAC
jgi:hypothetical protein